MSSLSPKFAGTLPGTCRMTTRIRPGFDSPATSATGASRCLAIIVKLAPEVPLRDANAPNPASTMASQQRDRDRLPKALAAARLLLQREDPVHQILDVGVRGENVRRHRCLTPDMRPALLDLVPEPGRRVLVALVL